MVTMDEMVGLLNRKGQKQTHRSMRQISKQMDLTRCSIIQPAFFSDFYAQKQLLLSVRLSHRNSVCPSVTRVD